MLRSYDLVVQARVPGEPFRLDEARGALAAAGAAIDEQGRGSWRLPAGQLELAPVLEGGIAVGVEVRVPLSDRAQLLEAAVRALAELPAAEGLRVVDPQRGAPLSVAALQSTSDEFFRLARHAGEYGGVSEALGLASYAQHEEPTSASTRVLLALAVFLAVLYATWRGVSALLDSQAEAAVDPPSKILGE